MRIRLLSDLHLEFGDFTPPAVTADLVVLAGDVDVGERGVAWTRRHFEDVPVVYVPGNHEYYRGSLGHTLAALRAAAHGSTVRVLDNEACVVAGVRVLGATLWTDYALTGVPTLAMREAAQSMNDFRHIRDERWRRIAPADLAERHAHSRAFLVRTLAEPFPGPTVVVSHHAPAAQSVAARLTRDGHLSAAYASRLEALMAEADIALWLHGHVHESLDYRAGTTRVVCNPRGYTPMALNPGFRADLVLEVA